MTEYNAMFSCPLANHFAQATFSPLKNVLLVCVLVYMMRPSKFTKRKSTACNLPDIMSLHVLSRHMGLQMVRAKHTNGHSHGSSSAQNVKCSACIDGHTSFVSCIMFCC